MPRTNPNTLQSYRSPTLFAFIFAVGAILLIECGLRLIVNQPLQGWDYWSPTAAAKYNEYFRLRNAGNVPEVLVVGDSTGDHGFAPDVFDKALGKNRLSYNIATLGNFPLAFDRTITDMIIEAPGPHPRCIIAVFQRGGFCVRDAPYPSELSILGSPVVRAMDGELAAGHILYLCRLFQSRQSLLDLVKGRQIVTLRKLGYRARGGKPDADEEPREDGAEGQSNPARQYALCPDRMARLDRLSEVCHARGIDFILVHPPEDAAMEGRFIGMDIYNERAAEMLQPRGSAVLGLFAGGGSYSPAGRSGSPWFGRSDPPNPKNGRALHAVSQPNGSG
jgi:hypothetical protein